NYKRLGIQLKKNNNTETTPIHVVNEGQPSSLPSLVGWPTVGQEETPLLLFSEEDYKRQKLRLMLISRP
ncbi:hypothetical protein MKW98_000254, partial [Papaver atlanticum]